MKKFIVLLFFIAILISSGIALASDITSALFYGTIRATNSGTLAENVSANVSISTLDLIASGILNSSVSNAAIVNTSGSDTAFMPGYGTNPWIVFYSSISANSSKDTTMYTNASGGKIRYFPDDSGMTSADATPWFGGADNFTLEQSGYIDTTSGSDKNLIRKDGAIETYVSPTTSGVIKSDLYQTSTSTTSTQNDTNSGVYLDSDDSTRAGEEFTALVASNITSATFKLGKSGSPTGTAYCRVYRVSDGSLLGTLGSIDVSTLGAPYADRTFNTSSVLVDRDEAVYIVMQYDGGNSSDKVAFAVQTTDVYADGVYCYYIGSWNTSSTADSYFSVTYHAAVSVSATGVESGEHTIDVGMDPPFFGIGVDASSFALPVTDNLTLNAPLWQTECSSSPFTTIDDNVITATVIGATWTSQGYNFDGDDYILLGNPASLNITDTLTVIMWANMAVDDARVDGLYHSSNGYYLNANNAGHLREWRAYLSGTSVASLYTTKSDFAKNTWYQVAFTYDSGGGANNYKIYVDGVIDNQITNTGSIINTMASIGLAGTASNPGYRFQGIIGEAQIYSRALSAPEIAQDYNATKSKYTSGDIYTYSTLSALLSNTEDIVSFENGVMPYVEYQEITIDGEQQQYIDWEYATTFSDDSDNSHDAVPSFRTISSDADVSTSLVSFTPTTLAQVSESTALEWPTMVTDAPEEPETSYSEEARPGIFFEPLVNTIATAAAFADSGDLHGMTAALYEALFWYNFAFFFIIAGGMLTFYFFAKNNQQALLIKIIVMLAIMIFWSLPGPNIYGMFVPLYFGLWCIGVLVLSRSYGW